MIDDTTYKALLRDFGDSTGADDETVAVFSKEEVTEIWDALSGASSDWQRRRAALAWMFERTLNSATRLHDYTAGETQEKLSQVYAQLEKRYRDYLPDLQAALGPAKAPVAFVSLRAKPRQGRVLPDA